MALGLSWLRPQQTQIQKSWHQVGSELRGRQRSRCLRTQYTYMQDKQGGGWANLHSVLCMGGRLNLQSCGRENCNLYAHTPGDALAIHVTLASLTCSCQQHIFTLEVIYSPQFELFPPGYKKLFLPGCKKWLWLNVWPLLLLSQMSFHALLVVAGGQDSANYISATLCLSGRFLQEGSRRRLEGKRKDVLYPACVSFLLLQ